MSKGTLYASHHFTVCLSLLTILQSVTPTFYSKKLTFSPEEFLVTYVPSEDSWSTRLDERNDRVRILPFRRPTRNSGNGDEARYQIRHVGDLPMFRFG